MKTESREEEITLKQSRLNMLLRSSEGLAEHNYISCREYLLIFVDTVSSTTEAGRQLREKYSELLQGFNEGIDTISRIIHTFRYGRTLNEDPLNGLPTDQYEDEETLKVQRYFARELHSFCWDTANSYSLIPSE